MSEIFVLEDFTLLAQKNFNDAVNTCAHLFILLSSGVEWSAVTESEQKYLVLDNEPYMARTEDYAAKMDFWQEIFPC